MKPDYERCTTITRNKRIPVKENGKSFVLLNPRRLRVESIEVDDCLFGEDTKKCDHMFCPETPKTEDKLVYYVELKGSDVDEAFLQLESTLALTRERFGEHLKYCYIVLRSAPKARTAIQSAKARLKKKHKATLRTENTKAEVTI